MNLFRKMIESGVEEFVGHKIKSQSRLFEFVDILIVYQSVSSLESRIAVTDEYDIMARIRNRLVTTA